jgi:hypothetical protein
MRSTGAGRSLPQKGAGAYKGLWVEGARLADPKEWWL